MSTIVTQQDLQFLENVYLPKWPQMVVWGVPVTDEQAKDIILRTDSFLTDICQYGGGNNKRWGAWARTELGFKHLSDDESHGHWRLQSLIQEKLRTHIGFVETEYVHNVWAACAFIYGPHGWCHPNGTIWYEDNVGKDPCARVIFEDWQALANAFPFLDLTVTLFNGESAEDDTAPVVSFRVQGGHVALLADVATPGPRPVPQRDERALLRQLVTNPSREQGLDDQWIRDYGAVLVPLVVQFEIEAKQELEQKASKPA